MMRSGFCFASRPKFLSAQFGPSYTRCISTVKIGDADNPVCAPTRRQDCPRHQIIREPIHPEPVGRAEDAYACATDRRMVRVAAAVNVRPQAFPSPAVQ